MGSLDSGEGLGSQRDGSVCWVAQETTQDWLKTRESGSYTYVGDRLCVFLITDYVQGRVLQR